MSVAAWRMYPSLIHCTALVTASDADIVLLFISVSIVGMKYVNVITLSTSTAAPAASHQLRTSFGDTHAAARLANVSNVSGMVVTYTQNRRPTFAWRAAWAFHRYPELAEKFSH